MMPCRHLVSLLLFASACAHGSAGRPPAALQHLVFFVDDQSTATGEEGNAAADQQAADSIEGAVAARLVEHGFNVVRNRSQRFDLRLRISVSYFNDGMRSLPINIRQASVSVEDDGGIVEQFSFADPMAMPPSELADDLVEGLEESQRLVQRAATASAADLEKKSRESLKLDVPSAVLVVGLKGATEAEVGLAHLLTKLLLSQLHAVAGLTPTSLDDVRTLLSVERQRDALGCEAANCLAEIGGALGAEIVCFGDVGVIGSKHLVSVSLVDSKSSAVVARVSRTLDGGEDALAREIPLLTHDLVVQLNRRSAR